MDQSASTMGASSAATPSSNVKVAAGYVLTERLGSGSFATVYKGIILAEYQQALHRGSLGSQKSSSSQHHQQQQADANSVVAIKAISRSSKKLTKKVLENLDMEIAILRTYRHPNIVCLHQVQKTDRHFYLVLEYCGGGDLQRLIRTRQSGRLSERLCRRLVRDLAAGLGFLWGKELVHRDIKPQNLLLTGPLPVEELMDNPAREDAERALRGLSGDIFMLKIADFGFARHLSGVDLAETMCGSPLYMAPEILSGEKYDAKADLWSVGAVLFEMIAGATPFHGENHMDLLRNIKTKAVRLPANVRISREFVHLLKLLLDRKPHNRAGFNAFFDACEALVALGCNGAPAIGTSSGKSSSVDRMPSLQSPVPGGQKIVDKDISAQMNLCAISEDEGTGESYHQGAASSATASTLGTFTQHQKQVRQPNLGATNDMPNIATTQVNASNAAMVYVRPDYMNKPGVVTPPFNPLLAAQPPPALSHGLLGAGRQYGIRPSIFTPLSGSPNMYPTAIPVTVPAPPLFMLGGEIPPDNRAQGLVQSLRAGQYHDQYQRRDGTIATIHEQNVANQVVNRRDSSPKVLMHEDQSSDSGFVMVEVERRGSFGRNSPSNGHSRSGSPHNSFGRVTILDGRNNMGMLGTSPGTGRALFGKLMSGSPSLTPPSGSEAQFGGRFDLSPRAALHSGGCLAHIDVLVRMLSASEDIGRRAITVAHLGDVRAFLGMGLMVTQTEETQKEESQVSSMSTATGEGVEEEKTSDTRADISKRLPPEKSGDEDEYDGEDMPFAMTTSSGSNEHMTGSNINKSSGKSSDEIRSSLIQMHLCEALKCYFKALTMLKGSISAAQKVTSEFEDVLRASNFSVSDKNPYTPLKQRCSSSLEWLKGQFSAILERADAANEQISKLQKIHPALSGIEGSIEYSIAVEELIYNHSLKCGREGAVKQILGHYDEARSCFRSAGLLAETLLMESKVGEEDRAVLEGYVNSFADQIITLDGLIRVEMRKSRALVEQSQGAIVEQSSVSGETTRV